MRELDITTVQSLECVEIVCRIYSKKQLLSSNPPFTYHEWRKAKGRYEDIKGFCNSASIERVKELDYVLTPGRYVGLPDEEDEFDFRERFAGLRAEFEGQLEEEKRVNRRILENLKKVL